MDFSEKLKRCAQGINKSKAAEAVGLSPTAISNYIAKGSIPRADIALRIANALDVPISWLVDDSADWPPPPPDTQNLSVIPDDVFMDEACRRLVNQAKRVAFDLERVKKEEWPKVADELLAIPATDELTPEQERMSFLLSLLSGASGDLREFDATRAIKRRPNNGPDLDDLIFYIDELKKMPEFKTLEAYFALRHVADFLNRNKATQADWDARDVEGQRKQLIANLARMRKAKPAKA